MAELLSAQMIDSSPIEVFALPHEIQSETLDDKIAIVVDVLRASSCITTALASGAESIEPCLEVAEARRLAQQSTRPTLLGGERGGVKIDGFDFGNSPLEYQGKQVFGKRLIVTTTNGTAAIAACRNARQTLIGCFLNVSAGVNYVHSSKLDTPTHVAIVCAGTDQSESSDDLLMAGCFCHEFSKFGSVQLNAQAEKSLEMWKLVESRMSTDKNALFQALLETEGGRNLVVLGFEADIQFASQIDLFDVVPSLDNDGRLVAVNQNGL